MIKMITIEEQRMRTKALKKADKLRASGQTKQLYLDLLESRQKVVANKILGEGYHEIFGIWFAGSAGQAVGKPYQGGFSVEEIQPGKHEGTFYGGSITIYCWRSQGYTRGIVLATADHEDLHAQAGAIMEDQPWNPAAILAITDNNPTLTDKIRKAISSAKFAIAG